MPDRNWNIAPNKSVTANASVERSMRETRRALGGLNRVDEDLRPAITRDELERLIHRAVLEYWMTPHVSLRATCDMALAETSRLIEQRGPRGNDA